MHRVTIANSFAITEYILSYYKQRLNQYLRNRMAHQQGLSSVDQLNEETKAVIKQEVRKSVTQWLNTPAEGD